MNVQGCRDHEGLTGVPQHLFDLPVPARRLGAVRRHRRCGAGYLDDPDAGSAEHPNHFQLDVGRSGIMGREEEGRVDSVGRVQQRGRQMRCTASDIDLCRQKTQSALRIPGEDPRVHATSEQCPNHVRTDDPGRTEYQD
jgi:hypothetical protein